MTIMFAPNHIITNISGTTQKSILTELAAKALELGVVKDADQLVTDYLEREAESTTGFGNGVAIPHSKSSNNLQATILFARSDQEVEWASLDGEPVNTWISLIVPDTEAGLHLQLLAKLSRQLVHPEFIDTLKHGTADEINTLITNILE